MSKLKLKPMSGYIIVKPAENETKTASGIILPANDGEKPQYGEVLAVGDDLIKDGFTIKAPVKVGDRVIYKKWGGEDIEVDAQKYQICEFAHILAQLV
ncbi:co-chaperone GroES [Microgenomates group bacterium]|nr:co-chaperone GroES [Microgenomates group bacterium]